MVVKKTWPTLQSCKHQRYESNDPFSQLPDELVFIIMSLLTIEEAARTCVLSRRWNYLWRRLPVLIFKDFDAMKMMFQEYESIPRERSSFLRRVNSVLEGHLGQSVDNLRVAFDLNKGCQSDMNNKWLAFALAKQVKRLELDFSTPLRGTVMNSLPQWHLPSNNSTTTSCLRSLSLTYVNITTKEMDLLFSSCILLETLCIQRSTSLRCVRALGLPLRLKHFEVSYCPRLRSIHISAPKLLSFAHHGNPIKLHIENASLLSRLSVGTSGSDQDVVSYALDSLSKYSSQLEYLSWSVQMWHARPKLNLGINKPPALTNLKHLEINIGGVGIQSLFGWADLMEASPLLERLTFKFVRMMCLCNNIRPLKKRRVQPLKSLKTLELDHKFGSVGCSIDLEIATYVVENSIMLKDVIVVLSPEECSYSNEEDRVAQYKKIVPQGVKLTLNRLNHY